MSVAGMQPKDDALGDDVVVWRRVHPSQVDHSANPPKPTSAAFRDSHDEMSLHVASETSEGRVAADYPQHGIVALRVGDLRRIAGVEIVRDPKDASHILAKGKVTVGQARRLRDVAEWVRPVPQP